MTQQQFYGALVAWLEGAAVQFENGFNSQCEAVAVAKTEGVANQLPYWIAGRKVMRKLLSDARQGQAAAEGKKRVG